ncbi:MAG: ACP phosphodiesterase [Marinobacter sp.]|uniref:acyl carrier protein phosphodiesterase n=1 Tax=Marinobacter sp. TaxID=50741 RepID=UPI0034A03B33
MNHLAHLFLARPTVESRVGNLLGDFAQGLDVKSLAAPVKAGLINHRKVDAYTDSHPDVIACKRLFSSQRRRFAGVALDVLYDHYLLRHWDIFTNLSRQAFIGSVYRDLEAGRYLMPPKMAAATAHMIDHDWFNSYTDLENIGYALDRIAGRIRFRNDFGGIIEEIRAHDAVLEEHFLSFFPGLLKFGPPEGGPGTQHLY